MSAYHVSFFKNLLNSNGQQMRTGSLAILNARLTHGKVQEGAALLDFDPAHEFR
jgi:hypothetical protein